MLRLDNSDLIKKKNVVEEISNKDEIKGRLAIEVEWLKVQDLWRVLLYSQ